jgi:hypothetical protein
VTRGLPVDFITLYSTCSSAERSKGAHLTVTSLPLRHLLVEPVWSRVPGYDTQAL